MTEEDDCIPIEGDRIIKEQEVDDDEVTYNKPQPPLPSALLEQIKAKTSLTHVEEEKKVEEEIILAALEGTNSHTFNNNKDLEGGNILPHLEELNENVIGFEIRDVCGICYEEVTRYLSSSEDDHNQNNNSNTTTNNKMGWYGCQHESNKLIFCFDCTKQYIETEVKIAHLSNQGLLRCPCGNHCGGNFTHDEIKQYVSTDTYVKYLLFSNRRKVESDPDCFFCPNEECGNRSIGGTIIRAKNTCMEFKLACSECHIKVCRKCGLNHSLLVGCQSHTGNEFVKWKNTTSQGCKRCPGCDMYIEKNEGCNHMTCGRCGHQFCWKCLGGWNGSCVRWKATCKFIHIQQSNHWGSRTSVRFITKSAAAIAFLPAVGLVTGGGAAAVGIAGGCVVTAGVALVPISLVVGSYRLAQQAVYRISKFEYKVIVMVPWRNNVDWIKPDPVEANVGTFMYYRGKHHPSGIFVTRTNITQQEPSSQSFKKWMRDGPEPISGPCSVVMYFIPRCTPPENIEPLLPQMDNYPKAAYPKSSWEQPSDEVEVYNLRNYLERYVVRALNDHTLGGATHPKGPARGVLDDSTEYTCPIDVSVQLYEVPDMAFMKCKHCTTPKYYTSDEYYAEYKVGTYQILSSEILAQRVLIS